MFLNVDASKRVGEEMSASPVDGGVEKGLPELRSGEGAITNGNVNGEEAVNGTDPHSLANSHSSLSTTTSHHESNGTGTNTPRPTDLHSHKSIQGKSRTLMPKPHMGSHKRIIVCCDGTWQDGIEKKYR